MPQDNIAMGLDKAGPRQRCNTPGPCDDEQADEAWGDYKSDREQEDNDNETVRDSKGDARHLGVDGRLHRRGDGGSKSGFPD